MLLCKMSPVKERNKPKEPKKEQEDLYANCTYTCACTNIYLYVYLHSRYKVGLILVNIAQYICRLNLKSYSFHAANYVETSRQLSQGE